MSTIRILSCSVATLLALTPCALQAATQTILAAGDPTDGTQGINPSWGLPANWSGPNGSVLPGVNDIAQIENDAFGQSGVDIRGSDFTGVPLDFTEVQGISFTGSNTLETDLENNSTTDNMTLALNGGGGTVPLIQTGDTPVQILGISLGTITPTTKTLTLQLKGNGDFNVGFGGLTISAVISSTGAFGYNLTGGGTLTLSGTTANTYTGTTTISNGTLIANKTAGVNAISGNLDVEAGGTFMYAGNNVSNQIADTAAVTINGGNFGDLQALPTNPGVTEKIASLTVNDGNFSTGRAPNVGGVLQPFTVTGAFTAAGGTTLVTRGGVLTTGSSNISGGIVNLDGGSTTTSPASESRLNVGAGGLTLNGATINFDTGASGLGTTSVGSLVVLAGNVTATGDSTFVHMNPGIVGPKATVDLGTAVRTFNIGGTLTLGAVGATVTIQNETGGGLIKTGTGTMTMTGASTALTGPITVSGGTLTLAGNGSIGALATGSVLTIQNTGTFFLDGTLATNRTVTVANGGLFEGAGLVNSLTTVQNGGKLQPGDGSGALLTMGSLTLGQTTGDTEILNMTSNSELKVSGTNGINIKGGNSTVTVNILDPSVAAGTYTLINYAGSIVGGFSGFTLGSVSLAPHLIGLLQNNTPNIQLTVTQDTSVWKGALSTEWSTNTLAAPKNWVLNSNNATTTDYITGDNVLFNDVGTGTTVDVSVADVTPKAVTFANITKNYTLTGSQAIAGTTGLTKTGAGTVTIDNTNSFTGAVSLSAGTVSVPTVANSGASSPLGAGTTISFNGGTLEFTGTSGSTNRPMSFSVAGGGTIKTTAVGGSLTLAGALSSTGALTKTGAGTLVLGGTAANTNSGVTTVSAGTLIAGKPAGINAIGGSLLVQGTGAFQYSGNNVSNQIPDTATITVSGGTFGDPTPANPTTPGATDTVANVTVNGGTFNSGSNATPFTVTNALTVSSGAVLVESGGGISAKTVAFSGGSLNLDGGNTAGQTSRLVVGSGGLTLTGSTIDLNAGPSAVGAASAGSVVTLNGDVTSTGASGFARLNPSVSSAMIDLGGGARTFNVTNTLGIGSAAAPITVTDGSITKTGNGTLTLSGTQGYTALAVNGGTMVLGGTNTLGTQALNNGSLSVATGASLTLAAHTGAPANVTALVVNGTGTSSLNIAGTGHLDLTNNAAVFHGTTQAAVNTLLFSGQYSGPNGYWDGPGINSSSAANDPNGVTTLGVIDNAEFGFTDFAGVHNLDGTEILVKYTYFGDTDLNGVVNVSDFSQFVVGLTHQGPAEWLNGDFDNNGVVNVVDFSLFVNGLVGQTGQLRPDDTGLMTQEIDQMAAQVGIDPGSLDSSTVDASSGADAGRAVVPEPGSIGLLAVGALGLLGRRRRR